jgi:hypothetical protein
MLEGIAGMAGQMEITDVKLEKTVDEPGESIEGYATRHYRFKSSWAMSMQGMPVKTESSTVEDLWTTTAIDLPATPMSPAAGALPSQVMALVENQGLRQVEGVPLKHVTVQSTKMNMGALGGIGGLGARLGGRMLGGGGGGGGGGETTTTIEVVDVEEGAIPASTFELPDGYQETSLFQSGPAIPNLNGVREAPPSVPNLNDLDD